MNRVWTGAPVIQLTAADDRRVHRVAENAYDMALSSKAGRYRTLCGLMILPASLSTGPGKRCELCFADTTSTHRQKVRPRRLRRRVRR